MASKLSPRMILQFSKHAHRRPVCSHNSNRSSPNLLSSQCRNSSTTSKPLPADEEEAGSTPLPRWAQTPPLMKAPVPIRRKDPNNTIKINSNPLKLDQVYIRMLGQGGDKLLSDEVKWLAVTHKSFDHGRRGFNDRLAYLGRRILELQVSLALVQPSVHSVIPPVNDPHGRVPFQHPATEGLENLSQKTKDAIINKENLFKVAQSYGLDDVIRWKPKKADNLMGAGLDTVLAQTVCAIVGAVALERGGDIANAIVKDRILGPLGVGRE